MSKIDRKLLQNQPKCVPGRSLASWLHLASFGHAFFVIFDAKMVPKITPKPSIIDGPLIIRRAVVIIRRGLNYPAGVLILPIRSQPLYKVRGGSWGGWGLILPKVTTPVQSRGSWRLLAVPGGGPDFK